MTDPLARGTAGMVGEARSYEKLSAFVDDVRDVGGGPVRHPGRDLPCLSVTDLQVTVSHVLPR